MIFFLALREVTVSILLTILVLLLLPRVDASEENKHVSDYDEDINNLSKPLSQLLLHSVKSDIPYYQKVRSYSILKKGHDREIVAKATGNVDWPKAVNVFHTELHRTAIHTYLEHFRRTLFQNGFNKSVEDDGDESEGDDNCTHPTEPLPLYNNSCDFVHAECAGKSELIDYLAFICCDLAVLQPLGLVLMGVWLIYLISLLATTVDNHFVPTLTFLAEKLKLSPSVAGITLLALGNGAPDIFVVYSGLVHDDLALVLGALTGAAIFITSVVLGCVILFTKVSPMKIDKIDFVRDLIAFFVVVGTVVAVAFDGKVFLFEACLFPLIYLVYIGCVIAVSYGRDWWTKKKCDVNHTHVTEEAVYYSEENGVMSQSLENSIPLKEPPNTAEYQTLPNTAIKDEFTCSAQLNGLTLPKGRNIIFKVLWLIQWPFSLLRWMTIPPFSHDGKWSLLHYFLASLSPLPISMLILLTIKGWNGFTLHAGHLPLPVLLLLVAACLSALLFFLLSPKKPPHWALQICLVPVAFTMAIMWLNLQANEIISLLRAFGLLLSIDTAILGLTVLAIGNCVADWVADVVVARAGHPEMAVASCFGSPLLSHVLGLSIALIVKIGIYNHGAPYRFQINSPFYTEVKLSWIFLGLSLVGNAVLFPVFRFSPPRICGTLLIFLYVIFILFAVLGETGVLPTKL